MKYYEYDCSWLPQFWGRHGEGYKNASATMRLLETGQPHEMRLWHESIESYVPTLLCCTAEQQGSKKIGNWLASWIQLVLHLRRGKPIGGGAVLERVIGPISAWMGCFWHNGTRREIACEADQWLSLVNQKWPPKVQQFVILPLKLPVWGIPHVSKLSLNILNMIAKPQSHRCHRNYMNSALVAASIFREIAGTKPREQRWFPA